MFTIYYKFQHCMWLVVTNCLTHIQKKNNLSSTCPSQHVCGDVCHTINYPVPQMVDVLHFLWVHEMLQSPRRGFLEAKCRPCSFNLVSLLPIEIRVLSVHANPKSRSNSSGLFLLGTCEEPCVCRESSKYRSTFSNKAGIIVCTVIITPDVLATTKHRKRSITVWMCTTA